MLALVLQLLDLVTSRPTHLTDRNELLVKLIASSNLRDSLERVRATVVQIP